MDLVIVSQLIIQFFVFSVLGWMMEVTLKFIELHRFVNRGFLIGPYCPIYGWGVVLITLIVGSAAGFNGGLLITLVYGFVVCGLLEYFTSWYMEKLFHARWWDYSQMPFNINGRVCLQNLILFAVASAVIIKFIDPLFFAAVNHLSPFLTKIFAVIIVVVMGADYSISHVLMDKVKKEIDGQTGDSTEEISIMVHNLLKDKNLFIRRIYSSYPHFQARPMHLVKRFKEAKAEFKAARKRTRELIKKTAKIDKYIDKAEQTKLYTLLNEAKEKQALALQKLKNEENRFFIRKK